jgi:hypothetical protein
METTGDEMSESDWEIVQMLGHRHVFWILVKITKAEGYTVMAQYCNQPEYPVFYATLDAAREAREEIVKTEAATK